VKIVGWPRQSLREKGSHYMVHIEEVAKREIPSRCTYSEFGYSVMARSEVRYLGHREPEGLPCLYIGQKLLSLPLSMS
jgi:hypothetical protein